MGSVRIVLTDRALSHHLCAGGVSITIPKLVHTSPTILPDRCCAECA